MVNPSPLGQKIVGVTCLACWQQCDLICDVTQIKPCVGHQHFVVKIRDESLVWLRLFVAAHRGPFREP